MSSCLVTVELKSKTPHHTASTPWYTMHQSHCRSNADAVVVSGGTTTAV